MLGDLMRHVNVTSRRPFFYWLVAVFNSVSEKRIKEIGPDLACAEWLLRNGARVKWKDSNKYLSDYNAIPSSKQGTGRLVIHGVDATDSGISHDGFPHFAGCKFIEEMKLINCVYIGNQALSQLTLLKDCLKSLEITNCGNVTDKGIESLENLSNLETLKISNLPGVKDFKTVENSLKIKLPKCQLNFE